MGNMSKRRGGQTQNLRGAAGKGSMRGGAS
jgi:hypothetical protein